jgi:hypothetical protein
MDSVSNSEKADTKALENAKTGKVITVVTVMHLYGNTTSRSISNNAKISAKKTPGGGFALAAAGSLGWDAEQRCIKK